MSDIALNVVVFGGGGVGKSAIVVRYITRDHFIEEYDPTIEDSYRKQVSVDGNVHIVDVLDTAGQIEYSAMRDLHVREGKGFILAYSITSRTSFDELEAFRTSILRIKENEDVPMIMMGTKCDLESHRQVTRKEAEEVAREWKIPFIETSAKDFINVDEAFNSILRLIIKIDELASSKKKKKKSRRCPIL